MCIMSWSFLITLYWQSFINPPFHISLPPVYLLFHQFLLSLASSITFTLPPPPPPPPPHLHLHPSLSHLSLLILPSFSSFSDSTLPLPPFGGLILFSRIVMAIFKYFWQMFNRCGRISDTASKCRGTWGWRSCPSWVWLVSGNCI